MTLEEAKKHLDYMLDDLVRKQRELSSKQRELDEKQRELDAANRQLNSANNILFDVHVALQEALEDDCEYGTSLAQNIRRLGKFYKNTLEHMNGWRELAIENERKLSSAYKEAEQAAWRDVQVALYDTGLIKHGACIGPVKKAFKMIANYVGELEAENKQLRTDAEAANTAPLVFEIRRLS